jgi:hypothetical protein
VYTTIRNLADKLRFSNVIPNYRQAVDQYLKGQSLQRPPIQARDGVLLIDEVDVFFGEDFYGELIYLGQTINTNDALTLIRYFCRYHFNTHVVIAFDVFLLQIHVGSKNAFADPFEGTSGC